MDIRNFSGEVKYPNIDAMGKIFELQKELLKDYIGVEGLPQYPLDVNTRSSQVIIKDFIGRIVEELGEAWESYDNMNRLCGSIDVIMDRDIIISHLQNFNEEISDAIHFFMELLIYSGFNYEHMYKWVSSKLLPSNDILSDLITIGTDMSYNEISLLKSSYGLMVISDDELEDEFLRGGRKISSIYFNKASQMLWDITYKLQIARNTLKNKPWKQTEMMTDESLYEVYVSEAWFLLFKFLSYSGFTAESVYNIYYKKNMVNRFRIKSKY